MRWVGGLSAIALFAVLVAPPAAEAQEGCTNPDALGVARTIEIDATGGPWLGAPHGDPNLLQPGEVVLTFDDGPIPGTTRPILAALKAECTKATFLMVGQMASTYPDVVREVAAAGHTVGTHTWSHPNLALIAPARVVGQIEMAVNAVQKAAGAPIAPFFRYPYLSSTSATVAYLKKRNIAQLAIDIDSMDYLTRTPQRVVRGTMARLQAKGRGIILMHDIHAWTAKALPDLLALLKAGGYKVVHLQPKAPVEMLEVAVASAPVKKTAVTEPRPAGKSTRAKASDSQGGPPFGWLFSK